MYQEIIETYKCLKPDCLLYRGVGRLVKFQVEANRVVDVFSNKGDKSRKLMTHTTNTHIGIVDNAYFTGKVVVTTEGVWQFFLDDTLDYFIRPCLKLEFGLPHLTWFALVGTSYIMYLPNTILFDMNFIVRNNAWLSLVGIYHPLVELYTLPGSASMNHNSTLADSDFMTYLSSELREEVKRVLAMSDTSAVYKIANEKLHELSARLNKDTRALYEKDASSAYQERFLRLSSSSEYVDGL